MRYGIEYRCRRRAGKWGVGEQHLRDQYGEVVVCAWQPRLEFAGLESVAQPVAVLEVDAWRVAPWPELGFDHERQLDAAAAEPEQRLHEAPLIGVGRRASRHREHVEVAAGPQPTEHGGAKEVRANEVAPEYVANEADDAIELAAILGR